METSTSLEILGTGPGDRALSDAVSNLSVATAIVKKGLESAIDRGSNMDTDQTSLGDTSEVSTPTSQTVMTGPYPRAAILPLTIDLTGDPSARMREPNRTGSAPPRPATLPLTPILFHKSGTDSIKLNSLETQSALDVEIHSPASADAQAPRPSRPTSDDVTVLGTTHDDMCKQTDDVPPSSYPPPSGLISSLPINSQNQTDNKIINSSLESTFDGFVSSPNGTCHPVKITRTSTPRPAPPTVDSRPSLAQIYPNSLTLQLGPNLSDIELPKHDIPLPPRPQRVAKRKLRAHDKSNKEHKSDVSRDIIATQTNSSDSAESQENTVVPKESAPPREDPKDDINITVSNSFLSRSREQLSDLVRSQIAEASKMDTLDPESSSPSSTQELSRLIAIMTHIGPIGQVDPPVPAASQAPPSPPPSGSGHLVNAPSHTGTQLQLGKSLPSRQPSPTWASPEEATSSWFDGIVASHAADNTLILTPTPVPPVEQMKKVKINPNLPSDENIRITRGFQQTLTHSNTNTRSVFLPQTEDQPEQRDQPQRLDLPFLIEREWRGARSRLVQGNKTKARATHLTELCQIDPVTGDLPVLTLWAMGVEALPDFITEDKDLVDLVATHRREAAMDLQSKIAVCLHERADTQLNIAHLNLAQIQDLAKKDGVDDFSQALDILSKLVGKEKAIIKTQLRKRRPLLKQRQPTNQDWANFHNFNLATARSLNKGGTPKLPPSTATSQGSPSQSDSGPKSHNPQGFTIPRRQKDRSKDRPKSGSNPVFPSTSSAHNPELKTNKMGPRPVTQHQNEGHKTTNVPRKRDRSKNRQDQWAPHKRPTGFLDGNRMAPMNNNFLPQMGPIPFMYPNPFMFGPYNQHNQGNPLPPTGWQGYNGQPNQKNNNNKKKRKFPNPSNKKGKKDN